MVKQPKKQTKKNKISGRKDVYVNPSNANITLKVAGILLQEEKEKNKQHKICLSFKKLVKLIKKKICQNLTNLEIYSSEYTSLPFPNVLF